MEELRDRVAATVDREGLEEAIRRCQSYLLAIQYPEGYWWGELESNPTMEAEYLLLSYFLGHADKERWRKIVNHIRSRQREDGSWGQYYQAPGDLSTSVECYFALKLAGVSPEEAWMKRAREFILPRGGVPKVRVFTKIWLALFGQWDWKGVPALPPHLMYLPPWAPFNIYQFSSWARATIVPMLIILARKPHCPVPPEAAIDELYPVSRVHTDYSLPRPHSLWGWRGFFYLTDKLLHVLEKTPWDPLQGPALRRAEQWILAHQEADGSWGGIQPPWVYSLLALKTLGYGMDHPAMRKGFRGFEGFAIEEGDTWRVQACIAPVWDTCLAAIALVDSGLAPDHPALQKAASWLLKEQVLTGGDWQVKARGIPPGGWSFEFHNDLYPDTDDSAEVIIALAQINVDDKGAQRCAVELGVRWLLGIQSRNGGWGSFDKDNDKTYIARIPFADFGESIDPPSVDVTAHILEVLGRLGYRRNDAAVKRALRYIKKEQEPEGCWFGRWGVNYVYGTGAVLPALEAVGEKMTQPWVQRAAQWLVDHRNPDGGWGESCATYADQSQKGVGPSTASQTAWALLALLSAGWGSHAAVERGVRYLVETQEGDGSWDEPYFTGTGFPGYGIGQRFKKAPRAGEEPGLHPALPSGFMINYHLYRVYWPLMALGRYKRFREGLPVIPRVGPG